MRGEKGGAQAYKDLNAGRIGDELLDLGGGLLESWLGDVGHEDGSTLLGKENTSLEANATANLSAQKVYRIGERWDSDLPSSASDNGVLAGETAGGVRSTCE